MPAETDRSVTRVGVLGACALLRPPQIPGQVRPFIFLQSPVPLSLALVLVTALFVNLTPHVGFLRVFQRRHSSACTSVQVASTYHGKTTHASTQNIVRDRY